MHREEAEQSGEVFDWYTCKPYEYYFSQTQNLKWCFWLEKNSFAKSYHALFAQQFGSGQVRHDFTEFHDNNLLEYKDKFMLEHMRHKLEFVMNRFTLFLRRVNK